MRRIGVGTWKLSNVAFWVCACAAAIGTGARDARAQTAMLSAQAAEGERPWAKGVSEHEQATALDLYLAGNGEFAESRFVQAIAKYREALRHWDHPAIRFNLAVSLISSDQPVDAMRELERSMVFGPAPLGPAAYSQASVYRKLLDAQLVRLKIVSRVPGAKITLDGKSLFTGRGVRDEIVLPGEHLLVSTDPGYMTLTDTLVLVAGQTRTYNVQETTLIEVPIEKSAPCSTSHTTPLQPSTIQPKAPRLTGSLSSAIPPPANPAAVNQSLAVNRSATNGRDLTAPPPVTPPPVAKPWYPASLFAPTPPTSSLARPTATVWHYDTATVSYATTQGSEPVVMTPTAAPVAAAPVAANNPPGKVPSTAPIVPPTYTSPVPVVPSVEPVVPSYDPSPTYLAPSASAPSQTFYGPPVVLSYGYTPPPTYSWYPVWTPPSAPPRNRGPQVPGQPQVPGPPFPGLPQTPSGLPFPQPYPPMPPIPTLPPGPMNIPATPGVRSATTRSRGPSAAVIRPSTFNKSSTTIKSSPKPAPARMKSSSGSKSFSGGHSAGSSSHSAGGIHFSSGRR